MTVDAALKAQRAERDLFEGSLEGVRVAHVAGARNFVRKRRKRDSTMR